jgi:arylamine N-acetyltransferase
MPQLFYKIDQLHNVDWETIAIYTCINPKCLPDFAKENFYSEEYGFIQFSQDFKNVRYGSDA